MDHIGIDVHKRESQIYILAEGGEVIERRIRTEPERFDAMLGTRSRARIVIEASTDSEWVARCLEGLGHEVIVADPNFAPMYATRTRKVKTDGRDARALAEACLLGAYRPAHRPSDFPATCAWPLGGPRHPRPDAHTLHLDHPSPAPAARLPRPLRQCGPTPHRIGAVGPRTCSTATCRAVCSRPAKAE
jgi:Transposase